MEIKKKSTALFIAIIAVIHYFVGGSFTSIAHQSILDIDYDMCAGDSGDEVDKTWYILESPNGNRHLADEVDTIKYYFEEASIDGTYTWTTHVSEDVAQDIKNSYATSMKKWNNVYFYSYSDTGDLVKHKIINVVEGTAEDHNLTIYPRYDTLYVATTVTGGSCEFIEPDEQNHKHCNEWRMMVSANNFYVNGFNTADEVYALREITGAHELGHVLGLSDVDVLCDANTNEQHHHEILMGYGRPITDRSYDITYKDIAGVAITRGFHTDGDHKWLNCGLQSNGEYKIVCSICNGVRNVGSLDGYNYSAYGYCGDNHALSGGNMMAVASYGATDYYKCKYCRYVATFAENEMQDYSRIAHNDTHHKCINNVVGLEYTFYEEHINNIYVYLNRYTHKCSCVCGSGAKIENHIVVASDVVDNGDFASCIGCGYLIDLRDDYYNSIVSIAQVSLNGSYILNNGIIVLVDEDIQTYLEGKLKFYSSDNIPTIE
ncbi:MAG: hypothetical protein IKC61_01245 [Clostridia bacterium]|nr:hypothetical protein [Clostridia bacterium]